MRHKDSIIEVAQCVEMKVCWGMSLRDQAGIRCHIHLWVDTGQTNPPRLWPSVNPRSCPLLLIKLGLLAMPSSAWYSVVGSGVRPDPLAVPTSIHSTARLYRYSYTLTPLIIKSFPATLQSLCNHWHTFKLWPLAYKLTFPCLFLRILQFTFANLSIINYYKFRLKISGSSSLEFTEIF